MPGEEPTCPVCGNTEWERSVEPYRLRSGDPRYVRGGGTSAVAFFCTRCDFIRLHRSADPPRDE